jgi:two-component system response regulator GlrR
MESVSWTVLPLAGAAASAERALSALARCAGIVPVRARNARHALAQGHGIVIAIRLAPPAEAAPVGSVLPGDPHPDAGLAAALAFLSDPQRVAQAAPVVVACEHGDECAMARLVDAGAADCIVLGASAMEWQSRLRLLSPPRTPADAATPQVRGFLHASAASAAIAARLPMLAACGANVLIVGETGTGKEVCAQAIHYLSARAARPMVAVNCGAIPAELVEAELFGHVKGAYTTAHASRSGLVQEAEGGTLFLDDVDCLPLQAQAKLLRFLQEHEYRPLGSNAVRRADVRVVAASNCDLYALSRHERFRQDLYFRLNVLNVALPPLRERIDDLPVLALHFARRFGREFERPVRTLSSAALAKLARHDWPGNVRELQHVIERAVVLASGPVLGAADIDIDLATPVGDDLPQASFRDAKKRVVDAFERDYIERLLEAHAGNITNAARVAKKDRRALFELIRKHRIEPKRFRALDA